MTTKKKAKSKTGKVKLTSNQQKGKMIIENARSTYMKVMKLEKPSKGNGEATCSTGIMIPKSDKKTVAIIKAIIRNLAEKKFGSEIDIFKSKKMRQPLKDGDELSADPEQTGYGKEVEGYYIISTKAFKLPGLVNRRNEPVLDPDERAEICVSGFWFHFSVTFNAYDVDTDEGGKARGVNVRINNLMFVKEGDRLDGGASAEQDFEDYSIDDDEDDDWDDED